MRGWRRYRVRVHGACEPGGTGANASRLPGEPIVFCGRTKGPEAITRIRSNAASNRALAYGPLVALDDRPYDLAKSQPSRRRPRLGWFPWRATRPRSTAIRTSCGPRAFWHAMRAEHKASGGTPVPGQAGSGAPSVRFSTGKKSSRTRCATTWSARTPSLSRRWRRFSASIARSKSSSGRPPSQKRNPASRWRSSPTTKSRGIQPRRHDVAGRLPVPVASTRLFARDHEVMNKRHGTLEVCWRGIDLLNTGKVHALVKDRHHAAESSSNSSASRMPLIRPAPLSNSSSTITRPTYPRKPKRGSPHARPAASSSPSRPSMAPGSTSSKASSRSSPDRSSATSA